MYMKLDDNSLITAIQLVSPITPHSKAMLACSANLEQVSDSGELDDAISGSNCHRLHYKSPIYTQFNAGIRSHRYRMRVRCNKILTLNKLKSPSAFVDRSTK